MKHSIYCSLSWMYNVMKGTCQENCLWMKWNYEVGWNVMKHYEWNTIYCSLSWMYNVMKDIRSKELSMNEMKHTIYCSLSWMYNVMKGWMYNVMKDTGQESCLLMKWNTQYTVVWDGCIMLWRIQVKRAVYEWNETHNIL